MKDEAELIALEKAADLKKKDAYDIHDQQLTLPEEMEKPTYMFLIKKFIFYHWDGIGFFGYANYKLPRM